MRAGEGSQASESRLQTGRAQDSSVFLSARPERELRKCDNCTRVARVKFRDTRQKPDWSVSRVHKEWRR
eukprot:5542651-Pleurochrysis_carterae.AAC.1